MQNDMQNVAIAKEGSPKQFDCERNVDFSYLEDLSRSDESSN